MEDLSVNVSDTVKTGEGFGPLDPRKIFVNPKEDPRIAGITTVTSPEQLSMIAPMAFQLSKEQKKPVIITLFAK